MSRSRPVSLSGLSGVLGALLLAIAGCAPDSAVRFGAILPLTGEAAIYGQEIRQGIDLAFEQLQSREGSPAMELVVVDSQSDPEKAKEELSRLYEEGARAVIGGVTTAEAMAMVPAAEQRNRVLLSPSASTPDLTGISRNFYRVWPSDLREGSKMGEYAANQLCKENQTAAILAAESSYARGVESVFQRSFESGGGKVVESIEYPPNTTDLGPMIDRVVALNPECVYLADYAEAITTMIRLLKEKGYEGKILTVSAFATPQAIATAGELAEWVFTTQPQYDPKDETNTQVQEFVTAYQTKYGEEPGIYAAHGYDAMLVLYQAMQKGGDSGANFWKGMRSIRDLVGVTGPLQFDEMGDVQKFPRVYFILESRLLDYQEHLEAEAERLRREFEILQRERQKLMRESQGGG